jgi:hypothetical protein
MPLPKITSLGEILDNPSIGIFAYGLNFAAFHRRVWGFLFFLRHLEG